MVLFPGFSSAIVGSPTPLLVLVFGDAPDLPLGEAPDIPLAASAKVCCLYISVIFPILAGKSNNSHF